MKTCPKCGEVMSPLPWNPHEELFFEETWKCRGCLEELKDNFLDRFKE